MRPRTLAAALAAPLVLSGLALAGRPEDHEGDEMANRKDKGYSGMRRYYTEAAWQARLAAGQPVPSSGKPAGAAGRWCTTS